MNNIREYTCNDRRKIEEHDGEYIKHLDLLNPAGKEFECLYCRTSEKYLNDINSGNIYTVRTKYVGDYNIRHDKQMYNIIVYKCLYCGTIYEHEEIIPATNI